MKIRTFVTCQGIGVNNPKPDDITIINMFHTLVTDKFPFEPEVVILLTFDEVEDKPKHLKVLLFDNKDKLMSIWREAELRRGQNAIALKTQTRFLETGIYYFKIYYNNEFLGKYPVTIERKEGGQE